MRITLDELRRSSELTIELLEIISLEGQQYMAKLSIDNNSYLLSDSSGKTCLFRSSWQVQDVLGSFRIRSTDLVHASAYHEMVGMQPADVEPLRIRIQERKT